MVAGGRNYVPFEPYVYTLSSVEIYDGNVWTYLSGTLHSHLTNLNLITFKNRILLFGGRDNLSENCVDCAYDNIMEYDKDKQAWYEIGKMKKGRAYLRDRFIKN